MIGLCRLSKQGVFIHSKHTRFPLKKLVNEFSIKQGDEISGFHVKEIKDISEFSIKATRLIHQGTGAEYLHLHKDDPNNVFCVCLKTIPKDSSGVAHILEHTVLCGSEKYPVRDPFFKMLSRSFSTFMNAMTGCDFTVYPFSTQNKADFKNLMSIYLDAVFKPLLKPLDFVQEGWRLELEDPSDKHSRMIFKGVVFNEMKGALADSQRYFAEKVQNALMPDNTYANCSGGCPTVIPLLSYENLKDFHGTYYHPSNAKFYSYGNFPLEEHLDYIHNNYLKDFKKVPVNNDIPNQRRWKNSVVKEITCKVDPTCANQDRQTTASVSYLLTKADDPYENLVLSIVTSLLTDGPNSPFYKSLIESDLGSNYSINTGFDNSTKDTSFSIGLQGMRSDSVEHLFTLIEKTFKEVVIEGFPQKRIEAILHSIELNLKHERSNFGLGLLFNLLSPWNHGGNPIESLKVNHYLNRFKEDLNADSKFLQKCVDTYFVKNRHVLRMLMKPDEQFQKVVDAKELSLLEEKVAKLKVSDRDYLYKQSQILIEKQNENEDITCLPTVFVSDIDSNIKVYANKVLDIDGVEVTVNPQPTNGVTYLRCLINVNDIEPSLRPYLPLFSFILTKMGTESMDFREFDHMIESLTGGLNASYTLSEHPSNMGLLEETIMLSSYCLDKNLKEMLNLWSKLFNEVSFSNESRLRTLLCMLASDKANGFVNSGHIYALKVAASELSGSARILEETAGVAQMKFLNSLVEKNDVEHLASIMRSICETVLSKNTIRCALNAVPSTANDAQTFFGNFLGSLPGKACKKDLFVSHDVPIAQSLQKHLVYPLPINFTASCVKSVCYTHEDFAKLRILGKLLTAKYLLREVREKGGAYGVSASISGNGLFSFSSYRDPNTVNTFLAYNSAVDWAVSEGFSERDIEEAKIAVFKGIDSPISPGARGLDYFRAHLTDEMRQTQRQQLLDVTKRDLVDVARRYLIGKSKFSSVVIGPQKEETQSEWEVINSC